MSTTATVSRNGITLPMEQIVEFCRRWKIRQLEVFGSFLRDNFRPDSDLDFLYTFAADVHWALLDLVTMDQELSAIVGREVDLVSRSAVERSQNYIRRRHILSTAEPIYVEAAEGATHFLAPGNHGCPLSPIPPTHVQFNSLRGEHPIWTLDAP